MVQGGTHNDTWLKGGKDYIYALKEFIDKCQEYRAQQLTQGSNNQNGTASGPIPLPRLSGGAQIPTAATGASQRKPHGASSNNQDFN